VQNLTSCSNIIETSLSRALLSQSKPLLLPSQSNTYSPAAEQSNQPTPLPINNEENAPTSAVQVPEPSNQANVNVPADLPSMLQVLRTSQPGLSMSQAMVILRNALNTNTSIEPSSDASLLPSIDLLSASIASSSTSGDISAEQAGQADLQARNKGLLEVLSAPDLSPATSDILNRFTLGFQNGQKKAEANTKTTRTYKPRANKKDKDGAASTATAKKTSGTKRKAVAVDTIEIISDTEGGGNGRPLPDPVKPSSSSSSSNLLKPPPTASTSSSSSSVNEKRLKIWELGCLKCGRTESVGWRIRKKRSTPLDGKKGDGAQEDDDDNVKKLCEGAISVHTTYAHFTN